MVGAVRRATIKVSGVMALSVQLTMTHNTTSPLTALHTEPSCCHVATSERGCGWEYYPTLTYCPTGSEHQVLDVGQCLDCQTRLLTPSIHTALPCYAYCLSVLWVISFSSATTWSNFSRNANCCFNSFSNSSSCAVFIRAYSVLLHANAFIVDSK